MKKKHTYPLDYLLNWPEEHIHLPLMFPKWKRQNIIKNVVFRRIIENRIYKKKPRLSRILKFEESTTDPKQRKKKLKNKLLLLYVDNMMESDDREPLYKNIMEGL